MNIMYYIYLNGEIIGDTDNWHDAYCGGIEADADYIVDAYTGEILWDF